MMLMQGFAVSNRHTGVNVSWKLTMNLSRIAETLIGLSAKREVTRWPTQIVRTLVEEGCFKAVIPEKWCGLKVEPKRQLEMYEAVARGDVSAALILTQHDGACELLLGCDNQDLAQTVLTDIAKNNAIATVGISQLTTSRRGSGSAMMAVSSPKHVGGYRLSGVMPWVTSAKVAKYIVAGAVLSDHDQILGCVETTMPGLRIGRPVDMLALSPSMTAEVYCDDVEIGSDRLMRGPMPKVLALRAPAKPLAVSAVGVGLAGRLIEQISADAAYADSSLRRISQVSHAAYEEVRRKLYAAAGRLGDADYEVPASRIRTEVNALLMRLAITVLTLGKGTGFRANHVEQKLAREALFFLVWSAPTLVQAAALRDIWGIPFEGDL